MSAQRDPGARGRWRASTHSVEDFVVDLTAADLDQLLKAALQLTHRDVESLTAEELPLGPLGPAIHAVKRELTSGSGMVLLRGLPVAQGEAVVARMVWGIGLALGRAVSQSVMGERLGRVIDVTATDPHARAYRNNAELTPHSDPADFLVFACMKGALEGGESRFVSALTVHDELSSAHPEAMAVLREGFRYHRFGEQEAGCPMVTPWRVPVFSERDGLISCRYVKEYVEMGAESDGVPDLTSEQIEALSRFEQTAQRSDLALRFTLRPGEAVLANNFTVLHARTAFRSDPADPRLLLRLWLQSNPPRSVVDDIALFERERAGEPGVPPRAGAEPSFASRFDAATEG